MTMAIAAPTRRLATGCRPTIAGSPVPAGRSSVRGPPARSPPWKSCTRSPRWGIRSGHGEDFRAGVGDEDGVFELGGPLLVLGGDRPAVGPDVVGDAAEGDHRLDGEGHAGFDEGVDARVVVVQDD